MAEMREVAVDTVARPAKAARELIDVAAWRLAQVGLVLGILLVLSVLVLARVALRGMSGRS
jgi:hypothetical protein